MGNQTSDLLETATRRLFVLEARKAGMSYPAIAAAAVKRFGADQLPQGWDERYAYKDIKRELDKLTREIGETAEDVLALELQRLDDMLKGLWPLVARSNPDYKAVDRVLKIGERRAKLTGIDAPSRHEHSGPDGGPIKTEDVNETRARLLADIQSRVAGDDAGGAA